MNEDKNAILARGNNGDIVGPQDPEYIQVTSSIQEGYPELGFLIKVLKTGIAASVATFPPTTVVMDVMNEVDDELQTFVADGKLTGYSNLTSSFSVDEEHDSMDMSVIEVSVTLQLGDKEVPVNFVAKLPPESTTGTTTV